VRRLRAFGGKGAVGIGIWQQLAVGVLLAGVCFGCSAAHGPAGPDAGGEERPDGRVLIDVGTWPDGFVPPPYYDRRGIPSEESVAQCGTVDGFVRCDQCEAGLCPDWTTCVDYLGICLARHPLSWGACNFTLEAGYLFDRYPLIPQPCGVRASADGTREAQFSGTDLPPSYCVAAREVPDLPPQKCVYPDGTEVVTGPPDAPCPGPEGSMLVCGGSCGEVICPGTHTSPSGINPCVGYSDDRAFGICAFMARRCSEETAWELIHECESHWITWFLGPCACMLLEPQATLPEVGRTGFVVPADACQRYQSYYPGQVECRDARWNPL
jgi:hypothetical protein